MLAQLTASRKQNMVYLRDNSRIRKWDKFLSPCNIYEDDWVKDDKSLMETLILKIFNYAVIRDVLEKSVKNAEPMH